MAVIKIITHTMGSPGSNATLAWCGAVVKLVVPTFLSSHPFWERSAFCMLGSRRCSAGGKSSGGGCQPHFTKPILILSCFFLHQNKCIFLTLPVQLWLRYCLGTWGFRFKFLFEWNAVGSSTQVFPSLLTFLLRWKKLINNSLLVTLHTVTRSSVSWTMCQEKHQGYLLTAALNYPPKESVSLLSTKKVGRNSQNDSKCNCCENNTRVLESVNYNDEVLIEHLHAM